MDDQEHSDASNATEPAEEVKDVESGEVEEEEFDPNKKTCYAPVFHKATNIYEEKIHPVILPYEERLRPAINKVGEYFDDNEDDPTVVEQENDDGSNTVRDPTLFKVSPACFGAAVLGFTVASVLTGPAVGIVAGAGAAYATSRDDTAGEYSKYYGKKMYNGLFRSYKHSKNFFKNQARRHFGTTSNEIQTPNNEDLESPSAAT